MITVQPLSVVYKHSVVISVVIRVEGGREGGRPGLNVWDFVCDLCGKSDIIARPLELKPEGWHTQCLTVIQNLLPFLQLLSSQLHSRLQSGRHTVRRDALLEGFLPVA